MPRNEQSIKWPCEYCTYLNFQTATRCVMCRASRRSSPTFGIIDENDRAEGELSRSSSDEIICPDNGAGHNKLSKKRSLIESKWVCLSCTYTNPIKNDSCVMCHATKPDTIKQRNLENAEGNNVIADSNSKNDSNSDKKAKSLLRNSKWNCSNCTYENWPRTVKCALCQTPRGRPKSDETSPKGGNAKKSHSSPSLRNSPPRSPRSPVGACKRSSDSSIEVQRIEEDALIELSSAMQASCKVRSDREDIMQIRNKMSNKDWLWIAACKGIIEHNVTAVKKYLSAGGDRTRQLTKDDIVVLDEPGQFEIGHTLVHLAIAFQREDILRILLRPEASSRHLKKLPSHLSPELAAAIRKQVAYSIRQKKGAFQCLFFTEQVTFFLPGGRLISLRNFLKILILICNQYIVLL